MNGKLLDKWEEMQEQEKAFNLDLAMEQEYVPCSYCNLSVNKESINGQSGMCPLCYDIAFCHDIVEEK